MSRKLLFTILCLLFNTERSSAQGDFYHKLAREAFNLTSQKVRYDPKYFKIPYPNGDIPSDRGVCTDVVIRAYRQMGVDLQKEVHTDMRMHFAMYPNKWGLKATDTNIDHRRVPNLMTFFARNGTVLQLSQKPYHFRPGDIVCWDLGRGITHIGLVVAKKSSDGSRNLIVHNIGGGQVLADCLFNYKMIGHYRYKK